MLLKFGGHALNSHGNYIVDRGKSLKNHGIVFLNFCWNPDVIRMIGCMEFLLWKIFVQSFVENYNKVSRFYCMKINGSFECPQPMFWLRNKK